MTTLTVTKKTQSEIKVLAINTLYEYAEKYYTHEKQRLSAFIGMDIFKVSGELKAKYDAPKLSDKLQLADGTWINAHYWFTNSSYSFDIHVKICVNGGSYDVKPTTAFCQYEEQTITLFKKDAGTIIETDNDVAFLKTRYNVPELETIANEVKEAAEKYRQTLSKMPYIFKDTFWLERLTR